MFISSKLRECREKRNLTETDLVFELAKLDLRISRQTLINWETGTTAPDANEIALLATVLEKPIQYFFDLKQ